jgi:heme/copper-type cytochrome/quinol oxidase subunit 2
VGKVIHKNMRPHKIVSGKIKQMNKNAKNGFLAVAAVIVVVALAWMFKSVNPDETINTPASNNQNQPPGSSSSGPGETNPAVVTREGINGDIKVPGVGEKTDADVAVPINEAPANPTSDSKSLEYVIKAQKGEFLPSEIIVNLGDLIKINFTAVDKDYHFTQPDFGFDEKISRGTTKTISLSANAVGKFKFYCSSCGGPDNGPFGYILITPK